MKLIIPNKSRHQYIIGIDFGHGETSAAICKIEWDKAAHLKENNVEDIDLDSAARKKVIPSSICRVKDGFFIGDEAFEHTSDNIGIRVCFKQEPKSLDGEAEKLMIDYMKEVYGRIRSDRQELTDINHVVYIARPSGWVSEESKELYRQMALSAGIPLAGLTSESRAAIFYAKSPTVGFSKSISNGAIVFDLGSSTLDFTYLSEGSKPIDYGYNLGASLIDKAILEHIILADDTVKEFVQKYPAYRDALLFCARKFKEEAYSRNETSKTNGSFTLDRIISEDAASFHDYSDYYVKLRVGCLSELNDLIEEKCHYISNIKEKLIDFKENHIPGKPIYGVFLTGGASRMNFIRPIIAEALSIDIDSVKIDNNNPSLTISRGIALLGATDATTSVLVEDLRSKLSRIDPKIDVLAESLASNITDEAWRMVVKSCNRWVSNGKTTDDDELKDFLQTDVRYFQRNQVSDVVNRTFRSHVEKGNEDIRKQMNAIISQYAPGREISSSNNIKLDNVKAIDDSLNGLSASLSDICDSITNVVADVLWAALGLFLWGLFAVGYYVLKGVVNLFRDDRDKRKDKIEAVLDKKDDVTSKVKTKILENLRNNSNFKMSVSKTLSDFYMKQIQSNLEKVIIPIE